MRRLIVYRTGRYGTGTYSRLFFLFSLSWFSFIQQFLKNLSLFSDFFRQSPKKFWNRYYIILPYFFNRCTVVPVRTCWVLLRNVRSFYVKCNGESYSPTGWRRVQCRYQKQRSGHTWRGITTSPTGCKLSQKWSLVSTGTEGGTD